MEQRDYYLGLDIGTDSVGYAATDDQYNLIKFHGEPAWGVQVFDPASLAAERRSFRTARRRLDRRQQRVLLVQELFAEEIAKKDPHFYIRISESTLYKDDTPNKKGLFVDDNYTDKDYYTQYPTIHHLLLELMNTKEKHDVRLVYLACAWLVKHRGHFLSKIDVDNIASARDFSTVYNNLVRFFIDSGYEACWEEPDVSKLSEILQESTTVSNKKKELINLLYPNPTLLKQESLEFPFSRIAIINLLAGGTVKLKDLFKKEDYTDLGSISLGMDDDKLGEIMSSIGDDYELIALLRAIHDWALLVEVLGKNESISEAKVRVYKQHEKDLRNLKLIVKKYIPDKYNRIFKALVPDNYTAYSYHTDDEQVAKSLKKSKKESFSKFVLEELKNVIPDDSDREIVEEIKDRLELRTFMPKQKDTDNRVIPYQLYLFELKKILDNASVYLSFLNSIDKDGLSVKEKLLSVFTFRIPYFVGPLNSRSDYAWIVRKADKIYPWNFEKVVDLDSSEQRFIEKMTNTCTYLPGESVLPKDSLCYHKFVVLNEINNIRINEQRISVELKQAIYKDLFLKNKKVTRRKLEEYLVTNNYLDKNSIESLGGIDISIKSDLQPQIAFRRLMSDSILQENDVERIIERASYAEDKIRLLKWLEKEYPDLSNDDKKYICKLKINGFGRLSRRFLCETEGVNPETGEVTNILRALWETQYNLMELLNSGFGFSESVSEYREEYYANHNKTLSGVLEDLYISNSVKRPIYRTLDIVGDVRKAFGEPAKIFIEMTRGDIESKKGNRTKSRKEQILEFYQNCKDEEVKILQKQLEELGDYADNRLQGDKLFLYFMQLGKCMYSGTPIELEQLGSRAYDIDHIYPQSYVKDDSIINNKVLVLSELNGTKGDVYPINSTIRKRMTAFWKSLNNHGLISDEKYHRLTRATSFSDEEKIGFINRQLTETSQATKAIGLLLQEKFPNAEIIYNRASLISDFRQEFEIYKSRTFNDLHHAVDAYLNIVVGNVYNMKFTKRWFDVNSQYTVNIRPLFTHPLTINHELVWDGEEMLKKVKKTAVKNNAHFTKYSFMKRGGLFDQMPVKKGAGLVPRKKDMSSEQYGGYSGAGIMFYIPTRYSVGNKREVIILSVELMYGKRFLEDSEFAKQYSITRLKQILGKDVKDIDFPMGMRPWKVNTMLSLDGFRACISGTSNKGKGLILQPVVQFSENPYWQFYLKKVERLVEKFKNNPNYLYDSHYDIVNAEDNQKLYEIYIHKLKETIFKKRYNNPIRILENGKSVFIALTVQQQAEALLNIHQVFGRNGGGCNLEYIGGTKRAAATGSFSSLISNWKKHYSTILVIDASPSGLWEKHSDNLLKLL